MSRTEKRIAFVLAVAVLVVFFNVMDVAFYPAMFHHALPSPSVAPYGQIAQEAGEWTADILGVPLITILTPVLAWFIWGAGSRQQGLARFGLYALSVCVWLLSGYFILVAVFNWTR